MQLSNLVKELDIERSINLEYEGRVTQINGTVIIAELPAVSMYALCHIERPNDKPLPCQVVGFKGNQVQLAPLGRLDGIRPNACVYYSGLTFNCSVPVNPLGKILDPLGKVINVNDFTKKSENTIKLDLRRAAPCALERRPIDEIFSTGVRAIDGLLTLGRGQRVAILAGPGTGKSTLVGMIARNASADVIVIGLIGERGREVQHFVDQVLGPEGLKKSVLVVATSDQPPLCRQLAANSATAIAEYYRDQGKEVLLIIDSVTRYARALREVTLAAGELPIRQGFTPSVFSEIPALLERPGKTSKGCITAIYTVLAQNDPSQDVLTEELTSILDGHIVLNESLAARGIKPAIDSCRSLSRILPDVIPANKIEQINSIQQLFHVLEKEKDLISLGGSPSELMQKALKYEEQLLGFLKQSPEQSVDYHATCEQLSNLATLA